MDLDELRAAIKEVKARTERHLADVHAKIADLQHIERVLTRTAAQCSGDEVPECPILDGLFGETRVPQGQ